jgi:hypothetical protein
MRGGLRALYREELMPIPGPATKWKGILPFLQGISALLLDHLVAIVASGDT